MRDAMSNLSDRSGAAVGEAGPSGKGPAVLSKEVHTLTAVIKQLEEQLEQMMGANAALRKDYQDERARRLTLEEKVNELNEGLRRSERQSADKENLLAEVKHVNQERARLNTSARELGERLKDLAQQQEGEAKKIERLRAAHADAIEEVQSVEAQFERAMQVIAQTRAQLAIACEERDQHSARARNSETLVKELRQERDTLVAEVEQSRAALDEIRQSLVDVVASRGEESGGRSSAPVATKGQT
jgi:chromosome segregation ATPase